MSKPITFISEDEAEESKAMLVIMVAVFAILAIFLALFVGFRLAESQTAKPGEIYIKSELTKDQIKALNIAPAKPEKIHAR